MILEVTRGFSQLRAKGNSCSITANKYYYLIPGMCVAGLGCTLNVLHTARNSDTSLTYVRQLNTTRNNSIEGNWKCTQQYLRTYAKLAITATIATLGVGTENTYHTRCVVAYVRRLYHQKKHSDTYVAGTGNTTCTYISIWARNTKNIMPDRGRPAPYTIQRNTTPRVTPEIWYRAQDRSSI